MHKIIDKNFVMDKMPLRNENSNKMTYGKILNIAGCINYIGAAYLSSISALKTGAGYITLATVKEIIPVIASMAPEITFKPLTSQNGVISQDNNIENLDQYNVVSIGCGIGNTVETRNFMLKLLKKRNKNQIMIIDADGLNILASFNDDISLKNTVITPHPKELSRLLKVETEEIQDNREKYARIASEKYDCITVLKGHNTVVTDGNEIYINPTGNSALAKAGTGDVLTGIISGLAAQKLTPFDAAIVGVYLHGLAGDIASEDLTKYSVLASDVIEYLPFAIKSIVT